MSDNKDDVMNAFKEKKWGKEEEGEYVTDGYSFRGKTVFQKALEGFKNMMQKGFIEDINGIRIQVLDRRKNGACLDVEIECTEGNNRGNAILKLYGPNRRKQNVITVSKCKGSEVKFVTILAEKVVRPLIQMFLVGKLNYIKENRPIIMKSISVRGKKIRLIKCPYCDKTSYSSPGLKSHITKMHKDCQSLKSKCGTENSSTENNFEETIAAGANRVIKNLLEEMDENEEEMIQDVTLEEVCIDINTPKKYYNECEKCGFISNASKRYIALRQLLKHKEECSEIKTCKSYSKKKCTKCEYIFNDIQSMKRHMRDEHNTKSESTSPPHKKLKKKENEAPVDSMEIEDRGLSDLSESFEEMDIDQPDIELRRRSELIDIKIKKKDQKNIEEEENILNERKEAQRREKEEEEEKRLNKKKRKQSLKDSRKSNNKRNKKHNIDEKNVNNVEKVPNIKEIPTNCKKFVNDGDVMYVVPGNGACAPNSAAALLFGDELFGPKLRGRMNQHMAKHFHTRYKNITQCSPGHPFIRQLAGGEVSFTDPEKLIDFLTKSTDAELMWCDSEDLSIIADMYQIKIKVITSRGEKDENPTVSWIYPDETMVEFAELKEADLGEMVLFHENDCHFNLIISKDSDLATMGSLSHRFKIGPKEQDNDNGKMNNEKRENEKDEDKIKALERELKKSKENHIKAQNEYIRCEKELRNKTEEVELLKIEIKDLKEQQKLTEKLSDSQRMRKCRKCDFKTNNADRLRNHLEDVHENRPCTESNNKTHSSEKHMNQVHEGQRKGAKDKCTNENIEKCDGCDFKTDNRDLMRGHHELLHDKSSKDTNTTEKIKRCTKCDFQTNSTKWLEKHMEQVHDSEPEFNCNECHFQGTSEKQFEKHFFLKHTVEGQAQAIKITCNNCGESFPSKTILLSHRKSKHGETVAICRKYLEGRCPFSMEKCWWNHKQNDENKARSFNCYVCSEAFETKTKMMQHRKSNHKELVSKCNNFPLNKCIFADISCWFLHEQEEMDISFQNEKEKENEPVFQKVFRNIKPPISEKKI